MPKVRDYAAELARRNERAKALGFSSYAQLRRAKTKVRGTDLPPAPPQSRQPSKSTQQRNARAQRKGFRNSYAERKFRETAQLGHIEQRCQDWSDLFARSPKAEFRPDDPNARNGYSRAEYVETYFHAWVDGPERYDNVRRRGSKALRHWLVDILDNPELDDVKDYDERYRI